jgi:hypothetical protein
MEVNPDQLQRAIEDQHHCKARLSHVEPVSVEFEGERVWEGFVHVFDVEGHPRAKKPMRGRPQLMAAIGGGSMPCFTFC